MVHAGSDKSNVKEENRCVPPILYVYISIVWIQICTYLSMSHRYASVQLRAHAMLCLCPTTYPASLALLSMQEVRRVTSHQPACIWDKWGINTYWSGEATTRTSSLSLPALPRLHSAESRWPCIPNGAQHGTCLVAQTQPLHRTQLCPTASPTDWQI